ncbi:hypothetical protein [Petropleomorpha daqingensis]|uniref:Uncharacterized protein n=1 Tax=Petropleomorpha daqingensis TaxID=2026353 RepID=A0A853CLW8_9ACTN|nr:hypothetical protein [Petropleomorpha daqingensis]NYJ08567.1 hypothetical protein [Petropleomorpha daqingensis]
MSRFLIIALSGLAVVLGVIGLLEVAGPAFGDGRWIKGGAVGVASLVLIFGGSFMGARQVKRSGWVR